MNIKTVITGVIALGFTLLGVYMALPRGIRNNNPMNIRIGNDWQGEKVPLLEKQFEVFTSPVFGIRAGAKLLRNYQLNNNLNTIREVLNKYAPNSENKTDSYIAHVSELTGFGADNYLQLQDAQVLASVVSAIIKHENGFNPYSTETIAAGVTLAFT
jgi:hypothetical protein